MAYTKYSLTPANNTAAPPDGAPEGMLPSAVNDTMRDMMAQIRDVGDGVRDGTYTMTAPKITGGTINGATIGATSATTGKFSTLTNSALTSGRITYAGASGLLSDTDGLTYDGTIFQVKLGNTASTQFRIAHSSAANFYADYTEKGDLTVGRSSWSSNVTTEFSTTSSSSSYTGDLAGGFSFKPRGTLAVAIAGNGRMLINSPSFTEGMVSIKCNASSSGISVGVLTNGDNAVNFYNSSNTYVASIVVNSGTVVYGTVSDYRFKENILPMTNALEKVSLLKPCTYTWKNNGDVGQGFIAHELQEVVPDAVSGKKDAIETYIDENGDEQTRIKPQGVDTSFLVATLTAAIQEQQALIESLTTRLTALENK